MKKSLFALAALGAFAGAAQAQSSVTLYGTFDASVQYISNGGLANGAAAQGSTTSATTANLNPSAANVQAAFVDGALFTSSWGMKGTEDLGGGMKSFFNLESDAVLNNGQTHNSGLFRRAAYVGIGGNYGSVALGRQSNPFVQSSASLMPVMGNTVNNIRSMVVSSFGDQISNAISYETPVISGFQAKVLYGLNNTADMALNDGTVLAAKANYTAGALQINAGYNKATAATPATGVSNADALARGVAASNSTQFNRTGYNAGLRYKVTPTLELGYGFWHGEGDQGLGATAYAYSANAQMVGLGYQATPTLLLGVNYGITTVDSTTTNLQARYSLSKRTMVYTQINSAKNGSGTTQSGNLIIGNGYGTNTNSNTTGNTDIYGYVPSSGFTGLPNTTTTAFGVGVVHMF